MKRTSTRGRMAIASCDGTASHASAEAVIPFGRTVLRLVLTAVARGCETIAWETLNMTQVPVRVMLKAVAVIAVRRDMALRQRHDLLEKLVLDIEVMQTPKKNSVSPRLASLISMNLIGTMSTFRSASRLRMTPLILRPSGGEDRRKWRFIRQILLIQDNLRPYLLGQNITIALIKSRRTQSCQGLFAGTNYLKPPNLRFW